MKRPKLLILFAAGCLAGTSRGALADPLRFESGPSRVSVVELFSSEGCSSCPPADRWLGDLKKAPGLWKRFVPAEYHVDYWNHLGWEDVLAQPGFSQRQQAYAAEWGSPSSVYTPGLVLRGREWRPWGDRSALDAPKAAGELSVTVDRRGAIEARYQPAHRRAARWVLHCALLGNGFVTKVARGENSGHDLPHDFVVLSLVSAPLGRSSPAGEFGASLKFGPRKTGQPDPRSYSAAFWVTEEGQPDILQATGGDLPEAPGGPRVPQVQ